MNLLSWLRRKSEIRKEREKTRANRGKLAMSMAELDENRHRLDEMVRDSLKLLEAKK